MSRKELRGVNALYLSLPKGIPWNDAPRVRYSADMDTSDEDVKGAQLPPHHTKRRNRASSPENISHSSNQVSNSLCPHRSLLLPLRCSVVQRRREAAMANWGALLQSQQKENQALFGASLFPCCHHNNKPAAVAARLPACPY